MANEEIVLCKMFTGNYWEDENNLGYETINMFIPDDQALAIEPISYIYLPASGDYKLDEHQITHVLLVRGTTDKDGKTVQIIGKAEVVPEVGELLREGISSCTRGTEFVGLSKLFQALGENATAAQIKDKRDLICNLATQYEMGDANTWGDESENYHQLALKLGFKTSRQRLKKVGISKKEMEFRLGAALNGNEVRDELHKRGLRPGKEKELAPHYYLQYALIKQCISEQKNQKEQFIELLIEKYVKAIELRGFFNSQSQDGVRKTVYGGLTYHEIFTNNKHYGELNICASLKVKNLQMVDKSRRVYLTINEKLKNKNDYIYLNANDVCGDDSSEEDGKPIKKKKLNKISAQSQKVYISSKNLWNDVNNKDCWVRSQPLVIGNIPYLEDSYLTVTKHEYDELTYSNLFAYFFKKSPEFVKYFFTNVIDKDKKSLVDIQTDKGVLAETLEISDEEWKRLKAENESATVRREEKNIDIVLNAGDKVVVIENKIKSALNGKEINDDGDRQSKEEDLSSKGKNTNNKLTFKDQLMRYYQYIEKKYSTTNKEDHNYFIFAPDYNPIDSEEFGVVEGVDMKEKWRIVRYSAIFDGIKDYDIDNDENLKNDFDKNLFKEFLKALYVHTDSSANNYYRQMQKRLMRIKAENDKTNNKP